MARIYFVECDREDDYLAYSVGKLDDNTFRATFYFDEALPENVELDLTNMRFRSYEGHFRVETRPGTNTPERQHQLRKDFVQAVSRFVRRDDFKLINEGDEPVTKKDVKRELGDILKSLE